MKKSILILSLIAAATVVSCKGKKDYPLQTSTTKSDSIAVQDSLVQDSVVVLYSDEEIVIDSTSAE